MRAPCSSCNNRVGAVVPWGGDGSAVRLRSHEADGTLCRGSGQILDASEVIDPTEEP